MTLAVAEAPPAAKPRVLVFGPGSIGAVYIYQLLQAGCYVTAVCRSNFAAVTQHGFRLNSVRYGNVTYSPDEIVASVDECQNHLPYDFILVTSKSFPGSSPSLPEILRPAVKSEKATIVLAQNGIGIEEEVAVAYPQNPILSGVIYCPAHQTSPGVIEYPEMMNLLHLGTFPAGAPEQHRSATKRFADIMIAGGGGAKVHQDIQILRWQKLFMNATSSPIAALTLCTDGGFLTTSEYARDLVWKVMLEIIDIARAVGIEQMNEDIAKSQMQVALNRSKHGTGREPSMLQDIKGGRLFEVEAILAQPLKLAQQNGIDAPRLETLYALLKGRFAAMNTGKM